MAPERPYNLLGISAVILELLKFKFSSADRIELSALKDLLWNEDPKQSRLVIRFYREWDPKQPSMRPAILVDRGPITIRDVTLGDVDMAYYGEQRASLKLLEGTLGIAIIADNLGQVEALASEVFRYLIMVRQWVAEHYELSQFNVRQISEVKPVQEVRESFRVDIICSYLAEFTWTTDKLGVPLDTISIGIGD